MKALSIIAIVFSLIGILLSMAVTDIGCYCMDDGYYNRRPGTELGLVSLVVNLFFLAFSIVATVVSFRKKKPVTS